MPDRESESWESGAAGPFLWIEGSPVEVWALGEDGFAVKAPGQEDHALGQPPDKLSTLRHRHYEGHQGKGRKYR